MIKFSIIIFFIVCTLQSNGQIRFWSDFEGGNGMLVKKDSIHNSVEIETELKPDNTINAWLYFAISGYPKNTMLTIKLTFENYFYYVPSDPCISYDNQHWEKPEFIFNNLNSYRNYREFKIIPEKDTLYFASFYPYTYSKLMSYVSSKYENHNLDTATLSFSEENRTIPYFKIKNITESDSDKWLIWIIGRQHAFEVAGSYFIEGIVDFFSSDDSLANNFRSKAIVYVVPMMDVDNVYEGASGKNQFPIDFNRDYNDTSYWKATRSLRKKMLETTHRNHLTMAIDVHSPYPGNSEGSDYYHSHYFNIYGDKHYKASRVRNFMAIFHNMERYKTFEVLDTVVNDGRTCFDQFIDNQDCRRFGTMCNDFILFSTTYEQAFCKHPNGESWTDEKVRMSGYNYAKSIAVYLYNTSK